MLSPALPCTFIQAPCRCHLLKRPLASCNLQVIHYIILLSFSLVFIMHWKLLLSCLFDWTGNSMRPGSVCLTKCCDSGAWEYLVLTAHDNYLLWEWMNRGAREVPEISEHQLGPTFPAGCFSASNQGSLGAHRNFNSHHSGCALSGSSVTTRWGNHPAHESSRCLCTSSDEQVTFWASPLKSADCGRWPVRS